MSKNVSIEVFSVIKQITTYMASNIHCIDIYNQVSSFNESVYEKSIEFKENKHLQRLLHLRPYVKAWLADAYTKSSANGASSR